MLGQKLGYDRCPYSSFFGWRFEDEIFNSMDRRDVNTEYTIFDLRCCEMLVMQLWMQDNKDDLTGLGNNNEMPKFIWRKRDPTPLGGNVVSLGKMIVYYHIGLEG